MTSSTDMPDEILCAGLPDNVIATIEVRDRAVDRLLRGGGGFEFVIADLQRWRPGQIVRVAFLGGSRELHSDIAEATRQITGNAHLSLDFGFDSATGAYRKWIESDSSYSAEIRVSFDQKGYFSLVGADSIDPGVGAPTAKVGGRPYQRSLNLGGFDVGRPAEWVGVVRHEFLHAVGFHHAHQNLRGPCEAAFRWEDDPGYEPTSDRRGGYVADSKGRRPGIYTYLAGGPNYWPKHQVDFNLRKLEGPEVVVGPFDRRSIMLYRFGEIFYNNSGGECTPLGDGLSLSEGDIRGLRLLYPPAGPEAAALHRQKTALLNVVQGSHEAAIPGLETSAEAPSDLRYRIAAMLHGSGA